MKVLKFFLCVLAAAPTLSQTTTQPTTTIITTTSAKPPSAAVKLINDWVSVLSSADKLLLQILATGNDFNATRDVSFVLNTPQNPTNGENFTSANITTCNFNPANPTRVVIHGWQSGIGSGVNVLLKDAYLKRGNFNVISVNWDKGADNSDYILVWSRVPSVAVEVAKLLHVLIASNCVRTNDLLLAGHSLGAHISGLVGKLVPGIRVIVGLDPAEPLFFREIPEKRLASTDARTVQVLHTSTAGIQYNIGTSDFYANHGVLQPGCDVLDLSCSHSRAYKYFAESIIGPNKFASTKCSSLLAFISNFFGMCKKSNQYLFGGEPLNENLTGSYYFNVNAVSPYGQG